MKNVLIAGGCGYIGTLLARELYNRNYNIEVVDSMWFGNYLPPEIKTYKKNVLELKKADLEGFDVVIFMAGLSNDPMADFNPAMNFVENCAVPSYLAFVSKKAGVKRFIYASTCSVYGYTANNLMKETDPVNPQFPYGISKLAAEKSIMGLEDENFRPISLRKGTVGGYSPRMRFDLVVNTMTKAVLTGGKITVNNPSLWRPLVDIRDVVSAYIRSIESSLEITGVYNISYDNYTIGRLADEIRDELVAHGYAVEIVVRDVQDIRNYKVKNFKAKMELDFTPQFSPRDSVSEILKNVDVKKINFGDDKYYNIQTFKKLNENS